jgi:hypothetical protein
MSSYLATRGWQQPPLEVYRWVRDHGGLVYGFEGDSHGLLGVWRLEDSAQREYLSKVAEIQRGSMEASLQSTDKLRRPDSLTAADVQDMEDNLVALKEYDDQVEDLEPPEEYRNQHDLLTAAVADLHGASEIAYRLVTDPTSATQADYDTYDSRVERAASNLRQSNEILGKDYETIEPARSAGR